MLSVDASELVITALMGHRVLSALLTGNPVPKANPIVSSRGSYGGFRHRSAVSSLPEGSIRYPIAVGMLIAEHSSHRSWRA